MVSQLKYLLLVACLGLLSAAQVVGGASTTVGGNGAIGVLGTGGCTLQVLTASLPSCNAGSSYNQALSASCGTAPLTWTLNSGSFTGTGFGISGQSITSSNCLASTGNFTLKVTDSSSPPQTAVSGTLSITVNSGPLSIS